MFSSKVSTSLYVLVSLLLSTIVVEAGYSGCETVGTRKEIRQMRAEERDAFVDAVNKFKSTRLYDNLVVTHSGYYQFGHNSSAFLPWNRYYLRQFEQNLQLINPLVTLPYWDWSLDSQAPERSTIFKWFGSNGGSYKNYCLRNGAFSGWKVQNPKPTCLRRAFDGGDKLSAFPPPEVISYILKASNDFKEFTRFIEQGIHGQVLQTINGDLGTIFGPNDPLYWLIHSFIDKIWADWQSGSVHRLLNYNGINNQGGNVAHCDLIVPWAVPVSAVLDTLSPGLCYSYSPSVSSKLMLPDQQVWRNDHFYQSPNPLDRQDGYHLRKPRNLSKQWIDQYALNNGQVQKTENILHSVIDNLNSMDYQSLVALDKRALLEDSLDTEYPSEVGYADLRLPDSSSLNNFCPVIARS
ncbi:hypothetical protein K7432_005138 [Basidiobolus ranarum]|uniref:Tyrosinase copper-binding domain-containing protein n=1 Tax=Basidiobolus ranarum TaxID=34480 RepID=A0ABR2W3S2_9FUNG